MVIRYNIKSPAKINIGLRVLSKRKDGFHNIETIFYPIRIYDKINLKIKKLKNSKQNVITVKTNNHSISTRNNICHGAVTMFFEEFKIKDSYAIDISIKKDI